MYQQVLTFWFEEIKPEQWWSKNDQFDQLITDRFSQLHQQATQCELFHWRSHAQGRLAEIIVLDQFSRNIYRDDHRAFSSDPLALALAQEAVCCGSDKALSVQESSFLYLPYMHSESAHIHQTAVTLYQREGLENNLAFELQHKKIIDQFGRYPHRNEILGRISTPDELAFLQQPGSSF